MPPKTGRIGVGIIGLSAAGGWAATAHVPAIQALADDFALVGLAASTQASARAAAEKFGVPFSTDDPAELAARPEVDLIVVATKVPFHRTLVEASLQAGKQVYCEWPLGNGVDEAAGLTGMATAGRVRSFVGLQARSAPPIRYLRDLIADKYIGEVISTSLIASGDFPWGGVATSRTAYVNDKSTGATMLSIPFGHTIDALCWTLGGFDRLTASLATRRPEVTLLDSKETLQATAPDQVAVTGTLANGAVATVHFRGGRSRGTNFLWEINGTDGDIVVTGNNGHLQYGHVRLQGGNAGADGLSDLEIPKRYQRVSTNPSGYEHSVAHAYRGLLDDLQNGTHEVPDFNDALMTHGLLDRIERAALQH